jgi:hypothetical protein
LRNFLQQLPGINGATCSGNGHYNFLH